MKRFLSSSSTSSRKSSKFSHTGLSQDIDAMDLDSPTPVSPRPEPAKKKQKVFTIEDDEKKMRIMGLIGTDAFGNTFTPQSSIFAFNPDIKEHEEITLKAINNAKSSWNASSRVAVFTADVVVSTPPSVVAGVQRGYLNKKGDKKAGGKKAGGKKKK